MHSASTPRCGLEPQFREAMAQALEACESLGARVEKALRSEVAPKARSGGIRSLGLVAGKRRSWADLPEVAQQNGHHIHQNFMFWLIC